jgi:O-antigen ligase
VLALPLAVAVGLASNGPRRLALLAAAVLIAIAIAFTLSRGGYLGALVAMGALGAFLVRRSMLTPRRARLLAAGAVIVVGMVSLVPPVTASFNQVVQRASKTIDLAEGSAASHLDLWAVGIRMATDYPVLGMGPEMYPVLFPKYRNRVLSPARAAVMARFRPESPHNVPIAIAAGAGLPALLAYLAIVMSALVGGWRRLQVGQSLTERLLIAALLAAALGHLTTDLFMTGEVAGSWTFWILLGVLTAGQSHPTPREGEVSSAPGMRPG